MFILTVHANWIKLFELWYRTTVESHTSFDVPWFACTYPHIVQGNRRYNYHSVVCYRLFTQRYHTFPGRLFWTLTDREIFVVLNILMLDIYKNTNCKWRYHFSVVVDQCVIKLNLELLLSFNVSVVLINHSLEKNHIILSIFTTSFSFET